MKRIVTIECCLPGCCGDDCIHRLSDTTRIEHHGYNPAILYSMYEKFDVINVVPHCAKETEREQLRIELFDNANAALEAVDQTGYTTVCGLVKAEKDAWDHWADQWWSGPCPFYCSQPTLPGVDI